MDECGINVGLMPLRARASKGERALGKAPCKQGKNTMLLAILSSKGMGVAMIVEGSADMAVFIH